MISYQTYRVALGSFKYSHKGSPRVNSFGQTPYILAEDCHDFTCTRKGDPSG